MQEKDTKEKIKKIISIIVNSDYESPINEPNSKIIRGDDYREICQLLGVSITANILKKYEVLSTLISNYSEIFNMYGITSSSGSNKMSYYDGRLILFRP
jgi:hypothetical protein